MKRTILILGITLFSTISFGQAVTIEEHAASFESGSHNSIVVTIPNVTIEFAEKKIKEELKMWGGKFSSSKNEFSVSQAKSKEIGEKLFDGYARLIDSKAGSVSIAFAFDLGGAYLTSSQHKDQFTAISKELNQFGITTAKDFMTDILKDQEKQEKEFIQAKAALVKEKQDLEEEIMNHNKKIAELKAKIDKNTDEQEKAEESIKKQQVLLESTKNKINSIE